METKEERLENFIGAAEGIIRFYKSTGIKNKSLVKKLEKYVERDRTELIKIQDTLEEGRNLICLNI